MAYSLKDRVMVGRAIHLLDESFLKIGNHATALRIGKHDSQITRWRYGGLMTVASAKIIIDALGHRRVK